MIKLRFPDKYIGLSRGFKVNDPNKHLGIDMGWNDQYGGRNCPVFAPGDGVVSGMADGLGNLGSSGNSYGNYITIDHRKWNCNNVSTFAKRKFKS